MTVGRERRGERDRVARAADATEPSADHPIDGQVLLLAGAKASVAPDRLPDLVARVAAALDPADYSRSYEEACATPEQRVYFVEGGHWEAIGEAVGLTRREREAVQRAHAEQLLRLGRERGRRGEFETALELREAVVVGRVKSDESA